jgi:pimeloyl-ACP methyl ester carboxylesterase
MWANASGLDYPAVTLPVRIWHGTDDRIVPLHYPQYLAKDIPRAELTCLPGVGHLHTAARWRVREMRNDSRRLVGQRDNNTGGGQ